MEDVKCVYFVRHGESEANIRPIFQGPNSPLTEKGEEQSRQAAARLATLKPEVMITSTMLRAIQTGEIMNETLGLKTHQSDAFVERLKPSSINDKPFDDPHAQAIWEQWHESLFDESIRVEDGENFGDLKKRAERAMQEIEAIPEHKIVVATHGLFLRALSLHVIARELFTGELFKSGYRRISDIHNGAISSFVLGEKKGDRLWRVHTWNDTTHLQ